ncbi:hypothetical protein ES703_84692 [subsurface metagenome]
MVSGGPVAIIRVFRTWLPFFGATWGNNLSPSPGVGGLSDDVVEKDIGLSIDIAGQIARLERCRPQTRSRIDGNSSEILAALRLGRGTAVRGVVTYSSIRRISDNRDVETLIIKAAIMAEFRVGNLTQVPGIILLSRRGETHKPPHVAGIGVSTIGNVGDLVVKDNTVN